MVGRAALVAEAGRRRLTTARPAIIKAAHDAIDRAPRAGELLAHDAALLAAAMAALVGGNIDDATRAVFERMLRHTNENVNATFETAREAVGMDPIVLDDDIN